MTDTQLDLSIIINGTHFTGWVATRFARSCETFPSSFEIVATEKNPTGQQNVFVPFSPCQVLIGTTTVLTGYIDSVVDEIDAEGHTVVLTGRSKCSDLVDCSAELSPGTTGGTASGIPTLQFGGAKIITLASALCQAYGITVTLQSNQSLSVVPLFYINIGDAAYNIVELMARSQNLLVYDDVNGNLVLSDVGYTEHASGFTYGQNIQSLMVQTRFDGRYSEIDVFDQTIETQLTQPAALKLPLTYGKALDPTIRHRRFMGFSEVPYVQTAIWAQKRANWEMSRRQGRSQVARLRTDSWIDSAGTLWTPNSYATVNAPNLCAKWVIGDVVFSKDLGGGTYADLMLMPPTAFSPEPQSLTSMDAGLTIAFPQNGTAPPLQSTTGALVGPV